MVRRRAVLVNASTCGQTRSRLPGCCEPGAPGLTAVLAAPACTNGVVLCAGVSRARTRTAATQRGYCGLCSSKRVRRVVKIGRNDPCPCGSGRKYKLCCGALAIVSPAPLPPPTTAVARRCGECRACCQGWAEGEIRGHRMSPGRHCHFLAAEGCSIYDERPQSPCRNFVCGWLAPGSPFPESFRPDRVGVIVVPTRWHERRAYILLSAGNDAGPDMLAWVQAFARHTGSPFYYQQNGERLGYGPPAFQHEMQDKLRRGEALW